MQGAIEAFFEGRPDSYEIFTAIRDQIQAFGLSEITVASQISFGVKRKFAWFWLYNVTKKDPNGIPHLMLRMDKKMDDSHVRNIEQVSANRWNHQIVVPTLSDAESAWLRELLRAAYDLGSR